MKTLITLGFGVLLAWASPLFAATITNEVSDGNDDAYALSSTGQNWTAVSTYSGYFSGYAAPYLLSAFRFSGIPISNATTITHAYLKLQAYVAGTGASTLSLAGEAYDSTGQFNVLPYIGQRTLTSARVAWSVASAWAEDGVYTSPDIAAIVQEIVNRSGWSSGNALAIQLRNTVASGGYQRPYSYESAATYSAKPAQLIIEYVGAEPPADGVKSENYIVGATNSPSLVPTYLNNIMYWVDAPASFAGLCWASCTADIFAYWDRNPYNGVKYWNLIDNGTPPLLQPTLPAAPGHDEADVKSAISYLAHVYYGLGNQDEKAVIESFSNTSNGLAFVATYYGPVSATADRTTLFNLVKSEINAGRPIGVGSWGSYFGGAHQVPAIGYKEMSNAVNSVIYIHHNVGGTDNMYANFYSSSWGNLDMDQIVPGGTPVDHYEATGDNTSASTVTINPDDVYNFRQTHNFSTAGDVDWICLSTVAGRQYVVETTNLGASCDTVLSLYASDGTTLIAQDDNGGGGVASKIVWRCWTNGTALIRANDAASGYGAAANYDLQVAYSGITNVAPTNIVLSAATVPEYVALGTTVGTLSTSDPDIPNTFTYTLVAGTGSADNGSFAVNGSELRTAALFNYEVKNSYSVRIQSMDQGGLTTQQVFTVSISDANEAPTNTVLSNASVAENQSVGTKVGAFSTQDPDTGNTFTHTLVAGTGSTDNGSFSVSGSNLLTGAAFNYEAKNSYSIRMQSADQGGLSTQKVFTISVSDVNEAPTNVVLSNASVAENLPVGTKVGAFSAQDPDAGNTFTHTLVAGTGGADNGSFSIGGSNLLTAAAFNYEAKNSYSIRMQSADQGGLSTQKVFAISVSDVSEPPPAFLSAAVSGGSNVVFRWSSLTNHVYTVRFSTNLQSGFSVLRSNITATPVVNSYTDAVPGVPGRFWQITTDP